ncbi:MAG: hypothetical protein KIS62_00780 [Ramlibacter sp.]|nr:hypothetical protein [Ramlibacter sp.]
MAASSISLFAGGRSKLADGLRDLQAWPLFDESVLPASALPRFQRLKRAVQLYLSFAPMVDVLKAARLKRSGFLRVFERCGLVRPNGMLVGWEGLVQGARVLPPVRIADLADTHDGKSGFGGMFGKLLRDRPKIEDGLVEYLNGRGKHLLRANSVNFRTFHRKFLEICVGEGLGADDYPLNTRSHAQKPLRRWFRSVYLAKHAGRFVALEHGPDAGALIDYGAGDGSAKRLLAPYRGWMLDSTTIDLLAKYQFPNEWGDWEEIELPRFVQLRVIDSGTGATLACRQVYSSQVSADDVSLLLWDALNGPAPVPAVVEGLDLEEGAGYPAKVIPELRYACCDVLELDNALAHLANQVQQIVLGLFGARVVLGPPRTPRERAAQESKFSLQARRVVHQLPGTTGAHPRDPKRKRAQVSIEGMVHASEIEHVLDAYVQNENGLPMAASNNISPLVRLRRQIVANVLVPKYLSVDKRRALFFSKAVPVIVKSDLKNGRRPFVNYLYAKYSGDSLGQRFDLVGKRLWLRPDPDDARIGVLFEDDGNALGPVQVLGRWGRFTHDARMRRIFGVLKRDGELGPRADDNPLAALLDVLRPKAATNRKAALQLAGIIEYLKRHGVQCSDDLQLQTQLIEWDDLQSQVELIQTIPLLPSEPQVSAPHVIDVQPRVIPRVVVHETVSTHPVQPIASFVRRPAIRR